MLRVQRERRGSRAGWRLAAVTAWRLAPVAVAAALVAAVPVTASAAVTWTIQPTPAPGGGVAYSTLSSVSCASSSFCVGTVSEGFPSGSYLDPGVEVWNGSGWTPQILPVPPGAQGGTVTSVSCASATSCVAIGTYDYEEGYPTLGEVWNGSTWTAQNITGGGTLRAISCASAVSCTAVGDSFTSSSPPDTVPSAEHWNGTKWTQQAPASLAGQNARFQAVSCPSASSCTAVGWTSTSARGYTPLIETWKGGTWQLSYDSLPAGEAYANLDAVSCSTPTACFATGNYGATLSTSVPIAMRTVKGSWAAPVSTLPKYASGGSLEGISCTRPGGVTTVCSAGGYSTVGTSTDRHALAEYWNGHSWISQTTEGTTPPSGKTFASVSCAPGTSTCEAGGNAGNQVLAEGN